VLVNGGLNLSELDGWWAEAYMQDVGWALGDGQEHGDDPSWDAAEAEALYERLEHEVIPEFYARDEQGFPRAWVARIRESMARLTPRFSATRTVREYTDGRYLPAAMAYRSRAADHGAEAKNLVDWQKAWSPKRGAVWFDKVTVETSSQHHTIVVEVFLGDISPNSVRVELYADGAKPGEAVRQEMTRVRTETPGSGGYTYCGTVSSSRAATDYTARIMPHRTGVSVPLEASWIVWQK
jgi:starch phosphorylase